MTLGVLAEATHPDGSSSINLGTNESVPCINQGQLKARYQSQLAPNPRVLPLPSAETEKEKLTGKRIKLHDSLQFLESNLPSQHQ